MGDRIYDAIRSALTIERALWTAPYDGVEPVIRAEDHADALASVAAVLAHRGALWTGYAASWTVHGLGELRFHAQHEPDRSPEDHRSTAVLSLDVPSYTTDASLRTIVSNAVRSLRAYLDGEGVYIADVIVVVTHRPEGA